MYVYMDTINYGTPARISLILGG